MHLTDTEKAMADGSAGEAVAAAMDLLIRYGTALGAGRLVETDNVAGAFNASTPSLRPIARNGMAEVFSRLNLDSDKTVDVPHMVARTCQLITGIDDENWALQGADPALIAMQRANEAYLGRRGVSMHATCTPYQVGNVPVLGEHCAWMESSAVIYCNGALGGRTNVEGKESTGAAALTGRIPYWGFHLPENRFANREIRVAVPVASMLDWGLLGYFAGEMVQENKPALHGALARPDMVRLKHFGAAAASSGGVEMYHIPGVTPEARTLDEAFGGGAPDEVFTYDAAARKRMYDMLQSATNAKLDFVMLGCPHNSIDQMARIAMMLEGRRIHPDVKLWVHTPRAIRDTAKRSGYVAMIEAAGGTVMSDTCPAISRRLPPGVRVFATASAKQAHYLPAIAKVGGWFGSLEACIRAAISGQWEGDY